MLLISWPWGNQIFVLKFSSPLYLFSLNDNFVVDYGSENILFSSFQNVFWWLSNGLFLSIVSNAAVICMPVKFSGVFKTTSTSVGVPFWNCAWMCFVRISWNFCGSVTFLLSSSINIICSFLLRSNMLSTLNALKLLGACEMFSTSESTLISWFAFLWIIRNFASVVASICVVLHELCCLICLGVVFFRFADSALIDSSWFFSVGLSNSSVKSSLPDFQFALETAFQGIFSPRRFAFSWHYFIRVVLFSKKSIVFCF